MAFIGNTSTTQSFAPAVDYFNGDGVTIAFTLSRTIASVLQIEVVVNNIPQNPSSAYSISGNTITFTSAPPSGTSNIYVLYTSPIIQLIQPSPGTSSKAVLDVTGAGTGGMVFPSGTTAQRPAPIAGEARWNTDTSSLEIYNGSTWAAPGLTSAQVVGRALIFGG